MDDIAIKSDKNKKYDVQKVSVYSELKFQFVVSCLFLERMVCCSQQSYINIF